MINTVRDLIGALQLHNNNQSVRVGGVPITAVGALNNQSTVVIYTAAVPSNVISAGAVGTPSGLSSPRLEVD